MKVGAWVMTTIYHQCFRWATVPLVVALVAGCAGTTKVEPSHPLMSATVESAKVYFIANSVNDVLQRTRLERCGCNRGVPWAGALMTARNPQAGDRVKLVRIPPAVVSNRERFPETFELFEKSVGHTYQVRDIDEHGHAELWLQDDGSEDSTGAAHSIWVEPEFVLTV